MLGSELKSGDKFFHNGKNWICKDNDGFILHADNMDSKDQEHSFMWIGCADRNTVELIEEDKYGSKH